MADELNIPGFKHYELDSTYQAKLAAGEVNAKDLSFVKETGKIYTQGGEYGGGSGECVADKVVRTLYGLYGELTDEQRAYNVETFNMYGDPNSEVPTVVIGGRFLINIDNNSSKITYGLIEEYPTNTLVGTVLERMILYLFSDGSVQVDESSLTQCASFCLLYPSPQMAEMFFNGYDKFAGVKGVLPNAGRYCFVDTVVDQIKDGIGTSRYVEWNDGDKRYRTHFDTSYRVSSTEEIVSGGSGGGSGNYLEVRELKMNDDMTVTEEQKAYNAETFNKAQAGEVFALNVMGFVLDMGMVLSEPVDAVLFSFVTPNPFEEGIMSLNVALFPDGTFNVRQLDYGIVDTAMSDSSENAVQNKVVKAYIDDAVANAGGGGGGSVADKIVRTLYGMFEELTDEQRAYNVETYQMFFSSVFPPLVIVGPFNAEYNIDALPSSGEPVSLTMKNIAREFGIITLQNVTLNSDGSVVGGAATVVPINCNLNEPQYARIYFTVGKDIKECNPCIMGENGMRYFIDASHASNSESSGYLMEYNTFEKRYRILIDPSTYAITSTEEISFGGSGGGGVSEDYVNTAIANAITTTLNTAV